MGGGQEEMTHTSLFSTVRIKCHGVGVNASTVRMYQIEQEFKFTVS